MSLAREFTLPNDEVDFDCPHGVEWGTTEPPAQFKSTPSKGPGTELKRLLAKVGIVAGASCKCNAMAARMDYEGGNWCLSNVDEILSVMRDEAQRRSMPFVDTVGRMLIRRAVRNTTK